MIALVHPTGWDYVITVVFVTGCVVALFQSYPSLKGHLVLWLYDTKWRVIDSRPVEWVRWNVWPRQRCNHCACRFTTWMPWRTFFCDHPNCRLARMRVALGEDQFGRKL